MIRSNPHTHSDYVDGKSPARETVERALKLGFESLGFSEHAYQPGIDSFCGLSFENREKYLNEIRSLQREYAGKIRIWVGLEIDRVSPETGEGLDYFIGASHYFTDEDGRYAAIDGDPEALESYVSTRFGGDWNRAIKRYFDDYAAAIERQKPTLIAHFDLIRKNNTKRHWFDEDALLEPGKAAMRRMIACCDLMEINTGGMVRSGQLSPYPTLDLLKYWRSLGGKVTVSSDCHNSLLLDGAFGEAEKLMRLAGYGEYTVLGTGESLLETRRLV